VDRHQYGRLGPDTPATGKPFSFNGVTFMQVENGKISIRALL
jgi:hypothetical protein